MTSVSQIQEIATYMYTCIIRLVIMAATTINTIPNLDRISVSELSMRAVLFGLILDEYLSNSLPKCFVFV